MTNANETNNTNYKTVDLKAIQKAEEFLAENHLFGVFYLFCGEIRAKGIAEKWSHTDRWNAIADWVSEQEPISPFYEKPQGLPMALTEWYEKIYLPSKWTNSNRRRYNNRQNGQAESSVE